MTMNIKDTIEPVLRAAIVYASGLSEDSVIFHYPNAPRPELPYADIQYTRTSKPINDWYDFDSATLLTEWYGTRELDYMVNVYGTGARHIASAMEAKLLLQSTREQMRQAAPISILDIDVVDLSTVLNNSSWEERCMVKIKLNAYIEDGSTTEDLGYFDQVDVTWSNEP